MPRFAWPDLAGVCLAAALAGAALPATAETLRGMASWYGPGQGHHTACGDVFDPGGMTAAHRSLPFGTRIRVTLVATGRSVEVRINDRGPFARGRILDLSAGAARRLGLRDRGVARVVIVVLSRPHATG